MPDRYRLNYNTQVYGKAKRKVDTFLNESSPSRSDLPDGEDVGRMSSDEDKPGRNYLNEDIAKRKKLKKHNTGLWR